MAKEVKVRSPLRSPLRSPSKPKEWDASAVGSDDYLASLTRRLDVVEKKLVGARGFRKEYRPLVPAVQSCQQKLEENLDSSNQATVYTLWNKITTLERLLDPAFQKNSAVTQSAREDLLLGYSAQLEAASGQVEELHQLKDYVNTTEFQGLDAHEKTLASVASVHSQQEQAVQDISQQAQELMKAYSQIMLQLSAQRVEWAEELTRLEAAKAK